MRLFQPLSWLAALALVLQLVASPALLIKGAAATADPVRAGQLLCDPGTAGQPAQDHHRVPAPDTRQCLASHGVGLALPPPPAIAFIPPRAVRAPMALAATASLRAIGATAYRARAPPENA